MSLFTPTIGLEIHAELSTKTKLFCNSKNDPDETRPNWNVCPVCMGHPGTLPTLNRTAVRQVLRVGVAVGGGLADYAEFDRKNYFYPDIPKGYQISQYAYPLVSGGELSRVAITRIHLEEDTARSTHASPGEEPRDGYSLVDFNRAGVPLMELVTEPVMHSAREARGFARELQLLLRYLDASEANMEKGEMRIEANISISADDSLGTKVEVKNLNSFRSVERAIEYEVVRQTKLLEEGGDIEQETRGWDEDKQATFSQRLKESSHDYRYFPDPDMTKLALSKISEFSATRLKRDMPELPWQKRERYQKEYGITEEVASVFIRSKEWDDFFQQAIRGREREKDIIQAIANYVTVDIPAIKKKLDDVKSLSASDLATIAVMKRDGKISSRGAKDILFEILKEGGTPEEVVKSKRLLQQSDETSLRAIVEEVVRRHPDVVAEYQGGKDGALQHLVGQGMKLSGGSANPLTLKKVLEEVLRG